MKSLKEIQKAVGISKLKVDNDIQQFEYHRGKRPLFNLQSDNYKSKVIGSFAGPML